MEFRHELSQNQSLQQSITHRLDMIHSLTLQMLHIIEDTDADPHKYWEQLIVFLGDRLQSPQLKQGFLQLLSNEFLAKRLLVPDEEHLEKMVAPNSKLLTEMAVDAMYKMTKDFQDQALAPGEEPIKTNIVRVHQAFENPDEVEAEISRLEDLMRAQHEQGGNVTGLMNEIKENRTALEVHQELLPLVTNSVALLTLAYTIKDETGNSYLRSFFRDMLISSKLRFIASDRIIARFAGRFINIKRNSKPKDHALAVVNTVFEYMLVAIGIVSPELFTLNFAKNEVDEEVLGDTQQEFKAICKHWNLNTEGTFFWSRWALIGQKPSAVTDTKIRDMMRLFQREDADAVLQAVEFDELYKETVETLDKFDDEEINREEAKSELRGSIAASLGSEVVTTLIIKLLQEKWYRRLLSMGFGKSLRR